MVSNICISADSPAIEKVVADAVITWRNLNWGEADRDQGQTGAHTKRPLTSQHRPRSDSCTVYTVTTENAAVGLADFSPVLYKDTSNVCRRWWLHIWDSPGSTRMLVRCSENSFDEAEALWTQTSARSLENVGNERICRPKQSKVSCSGVIVESQIDGAKQVLWQRRRRRTLSRKPDFTTRGLKSRKAKGIQQTTPKVF